MAEPGSAAVDVAMKNVIENVEVEYVGDAEVPSLVCQTCGENLCDVEAGDTMRVLLNTALGHALNDCS